MRVVFGKQGAHFADVSSPPWFSHCWSQPNELRPLLNPVGNMMCVVCGKQGLESVAEAYCDTYIKGTCAAARAPRTAAAARATAVPAINMIIMCDD
jgi:hypothetical protein